MTETGQGVQLLREPTSTPDHGTDNDDDMQLRAVSSNCKRFLSVDI